MRTYGRTRGHTRNRLPEGWEDTFEGYDHWPDEAKQIRAHDPLLAKIVDLAA